MSLVFLAIIIHVLYFSGDSLCNMVEHEACSHICDLDSSFNIILQERSYYSLSNETNYTYTISFNTVSISSINNCINDILSNIIVTEIWSPNCCNTDIIQYKWKFETLSNNKFTINLQGDIPSILGSYWVYSNVSDTNCIHKSLITVPNLCFNNNENDNSHNTDVITKEVDHTCPSLLQIVTDKTIILYSIVIISVILIIFMTLIFIIIYKHRKLKKYEQQIEEYYSDFRQQKNSSMKSAHYPSITTTDNVNITINNNNIGSIGHHGPLNNIYNRYSVTTNSPITFDIKSVPSKQYLNQQLKQENILPQTKSKSNEELSVSYSDDSQHNEMDEMEFLKQKQMESYSNELTKMANNQNKFGINNKLGYNNVPSFENENNSMQRHQTFL